MTLDADGDERERRRSLSMDRCPRAASRVHACGAHLWNDFVLHKQRRVSAGRDIDLAQKAIKVNLKAGEAVFGALRPQSSLSNLSVRQSLKRHFRYHISEHRDVHMLEASEVGEQAAEKNRKR